jgi:hypothetical protein
VGIYAFALSQASSPASASLCNFKNSILKIGKHDIFFLCYTILLYNDRRQFKKPQSLGEKRMK